MENDDVRRRQCLEVAKEIGKNLQQNLGEHFTNEEIKTSILENYLVAKNIPQVPSLDSTMETYLGSAKASYATVNDRSLFRILSKVRDITGPLVHLYKLCHRTKQSTMKTKFIRKKLDQTMTKLCQPLPFTEEGLS